MSETRPSRGDHGRPVRWLARTKDQQVNDFVRLAEREGWSAVPVAAREDFVSELAYQVDGAAVYFYATVGAGWGGETLTAVVGDDPEPLISLLQRELSFCDVEAMIAGCRSPHPWERHEAIRALGWIAAPGDARAIEAVEAAAALGDHEPQVVAALRQLEGGPRRFRRLEPINTAVAATAACAYYIDSAACRVMRWADEDPEPSVLLADLASPVAVACDERWVYVVLAEPPTAAALIRVPASGGTFEVVAPDVHWPAELRAAAGSLYLVERGRPERQSTAGDRPGRIARVATSGALEPLVAGGAPQAVAADAGGLFWYDSDAKALMYAAFGAEPRALATPPDCEAIACAGDRLVGVGASGIWRADKSGGGLVTHDDFSSSLAGLWIGDRVAATVRSYEASYFQHHALVLGDLDDLAGWETFETRRMELGTTSLTRPLAATGQNLYWATGSEVERFPLAEVEEYCE